MGSFFLPCAITNAMPHTPCQSQTKGDAQTWTFKLKTLFFSGVYFGIDHSSNNKQWCCDEKNPGDPGGTSSPTNAGCSLQSHSRHSESYGETLGIASFLKLVSLARGFVFQGFLLLLSFCRVESHKLHKGTIPLVLGKSCLRHSVKGDPAT